MATIVRDIKDKAELKLLSEMLKKMRIPIKVLSAEEREDLGLIKLMKEVDRTKKVSRSKVMEKLGRKQS
ncbi:MAG: hypothetical protein PHE33_12495 [Bacteroidales bacterium]|nr:hypothetical protein [Bacteroidales bacterium]